MGPERNFLMRRETRVACIPSQDINKAQKSFSPVTYFDQNAEESERRNDSLETHQALGK